MRKENNGLEKSNSKIVYNFFKGITYAVRLAFDDDEWVYDEEPHIKRRQLHPEWGNKTQYSRR
ncbi:hypothetical protein AHF37_09836 [Paragonimus kellicotti]|nr:hypothetical protein AHF37_09836 [Paragonimus kellicotti]